MSLFLSFQVVLFVIYSFPGRFGGDPGNTEHHRDQSASAHCAGGLSQPAHGEREWGWGRRKCLTNTHILTVQLLHVCPKMLLRLIHADVSVVQLCLMKQIPFLWR